MMLLMRHAVTGGVGLLAVSVCFLGAVDPPKSESTPPPVIHVDKPDEAVSSKFQRVKAEMSFLDALEPRRHGLVEF